MTDYRALYQDFLKKYIAVKRPLTIVFDVSNGPAGMIVKDLFANTTINAIVINDDIDPDFKAHGPNPLIDGATDQCKQAILENHADIGVMFDADADRAFFLDDAGEMLPACFIVCLLKQVFGAPYVADELVFQSLRMFGIVAENDLLPTRIGAYFIKEKLRENNATFGVEFSGHYYFRDFFNADSGIFAAVAVINALSVMDTKLSAWKERFGVYKSITREIRVEDDKDMGLLYANLEKVFIGRAKVIDRRDGVTLVFEDFWINVRTSNTEPIMRIIAEGNEMFTEIVTEIEKSVL